MSRFFSSDFIAAFVAGLLAGFAVPALLSIRQWYPRLKLRLRSIFKSHPSAERFRQLILSSGFYGVPAGERRPYYYVRYGYKPTSEEETPIYHFFVSSSPGPEVTVQKFMAFLIPPLDFGHGDRIKRVGLEVDKKWETYLTKIADQAKKAKDLSLAGKLSNRSSLLFRDPISFKAQRLIFFDRLLLRLFLQESKWVIENAHLEGKNFQSGWDNSSITTFARSVLLYAFDITRIHKIVWTYRKAIECRYIDESRLSASQYYDFGYYCVEGVPIIYNPIYSKNDSKSITEEKVFIGTSTRQLKNIAEYEEDFTELWDGNNRCEGTNKEEAEQRGWLNDFKNLYHPENYNDAYYGLGCLIPEFFHWGYYQRLDSILKPILEGAHEEQALKH